MKEKEKKSKKRKVQEVINKLDGTEGNACPNCGSDDLELRDYDMKWHDGEIYCNDCGTHVRTYDAG